MRSRKYSANRCKPVNTLAVVTQSVRSDGLRRFTRPRCANTLAQAIRATNMLPQPARSDGIHSVYMALEVIAALHGQTEWNHGRTETSALRPNSVANGPAGAGRATSCGCWRDRARYLIASYCILLRLIALIAAPLPIPARFGWAWQGDVRGHAISAARPGIAPYCVEMRRNASDCVLLRLITSCSNRPALPSVRVGPAEQGSFPSSPGSTTGQRIGPSPSTYVFASYLVSLRLIASTAARQRASEQGKV